MKLQIALDTLSSKEGIGLMEAMADSVDIIEIGTPLIMREGLSAVKAFRAEFPRHIILADTKIMDAGHYEASLAYQAGADLVTVLAVAGDNTIKGCLQAAESFQKELMSDMIGVKELFARAAQLDQMGVRHLCIHTAVDDQSLTNGPWVELETALGAVSSAGIAVAGGINLSNLHEVLAYRPGIIIVGGAVTGAEEPAKTAAAMKKIILNP